MTAAIVLAGLCGVAFTAGPVVLALLWYRQLQAIPQPWAAREANPDERTGPLHELAVATLAEAHERRGRLLASVAMQLGAVIGGADSDEDVYRAIIRALAADLAASAALRSRCQRAEDALRTISALALRTQVPRDAAVTPERVVFQVVVTWCRSRSSAALSN